MSQKDLFRANSQLRGVDLTEEEIRKIANRQAWRVENEIELEVGGRNSQEGISRTSSRSFRDLPTVSRWHIFLVIVVTVICAPSVMLTAHVASRTCWNAETSAASLEDCGNSNQGRFEKPWFICWFSYVGQTMCLLVPLYNYRRSHSTGGSDSERSFNTFKGLSSDGSSVHMETIRTRLCGCCCGHEIFHDDDARHEALEAGIKLKPYSNTFIGVVPTYSGRDGSGLTFHLLPWSRRIGLALFPAAMDLGMSCLQFVSLLYIPPSLTVMFKSLSIVWVTLVSPHLLPGRRVFRHQYMAIVIALTGGALIATSAVLQEAAETAAGEDSSGKQDVLLGILLAVLAGLCAALASISMEKMMVELDVDASTLVGVVGVVCLVLTSALLVVVHLLPGSDPNGRVEDFNGTISMLGRNWFLLAMMLLYGTVVSGLNNWSLGEAARVLSSVAMLLIRNLCTVVLWGVELALFYGLEGDRLGSALFFTPGLIKLGGFVTMTTALLLYLGHIKLPIQWLYQEPPGQERTESQGATAHQDVVTADTVLGATTQPASLNSMPGSMLRRTKAVRLKDPALVRRRLTATRLAEVRRMAIW